MATTLGHARADNTVNETMNVSHNTLHFSDFNKQI